jgi:16S rRNA (adenine1518-N6/adenine1519-N6)-dimethyltransferase
MHRTPRRRLSQHFLHERSIIDRITHAVDPKAHDHLVEIGPGLGALTAPLLAHCAHLDAVELDRTLALELKERFTHYPGLRIHLADVLSVDLTTLADDTQRLRIVGNLPYHISTPVIFHVLEHSSVIEDMHFMLQRELVERMVAPPGSRTYGRLSVMVQFRCRVDKLFEVGPGAFRPVPQVASAVVRLVPRMQPPVVVKDQRAFEQLVAHAFAKRRKTLRNSLKPLLTAEQICAAQVAPGDRPEALSLAQFAALANMWHEASLRGGCQRITRTPRNA